ncbi:MAG: LysR family transcriptional regulator substrate-binding protein, partial [Candidatus Rokuibacteriota bacterium]
QLECLHPHKVGEAVLSGEVDVGIMSYPPAERALSVVPLWAEPMVFVCHPNHRLARRRLVAPAELNGENFVAFDPGLTIRRAIDRTLRQHNVRVNVVMEFDNIETIKQAIIIAAGISVLPHHTVQKEVGIRVLSAASIDIPDLVRPVGVIHRRQKPLTPTAARFVALLREASREGSAAAPSR